MKTIKNIFKSKITYAVLACLLLVGIFAGLTTLASDDPIVTIESKNINHADSARLVYQVKLANVTRDELIANAGKLKMHFWTTEPSAPNATPELTTTEFIFDDTKKNAPEAWVLFESYNIAPKAMTNSVYCAVEYDGVYSDVCRYSVFEYLCEAGLGATDNQKALYAAMIDYIKYAQMYFGVDENEFPNPDNFGYIKLTNCYIEVNGEQIRDGMVPLGSHVIYSDYEYARYVNHNNAVCEWYNRSDENWVANLNKNSRYLSYTAYEAFKFTTAKVENTELIRARRSSNDGTYAYSAVAYYDGVDGYGVIYPDRLHDADYYILVPKMLEGKTFAYWADAEGNVVSTETIYPINDKMTDFVAGETYRIDDLPTPVYTETATADKVVNLNTATEATNGTTKVTQNKIDGVNNGLIHDSNGKTAQGNGQAGIVSGTTEGNVNLNKIVLTYKHTLESAKGTYDKVTVGDLLIGNNYTYTGHYQNQMLYGNSNLFRFSFVASDSGNVNKDITKGYYIKADSQDALNTADFNGLNRCFMKYGVEHKVTFIIDVEKNEDGTINLVNVAYYVDGLFVGSARARWTGGDSIADPVAYSNTVKLNSLSVMRTKSLLTVWDVTVYEFDNEYVIAE
jgi:hypothetical protein